MQPIWIVPLKQNPLDLEVAPACSPENKRPAMKNRNGISLNHSPDMIRRDPCSCSESSLFVKQISDFRAISLRRLSWTESALLLISLVIISYKTLQPTHIQRNSVSALSNGFPQSGNVLWYKNPGVQWAKHFLPIGNGFLGGMFHFLLLNLFGIMTAQEPWFLVVLRMNLHSSI
jgi:hypothetical protein